MRPATAAGSIPDFGPLREQTPFDTHIARENIVLVGEQVSDCLD